MRLARRLLGEPAMKPSTKKMKLNRETLRSMTRPELEAAGGAAIRFPTITCRSICFSCDPSCDLMQP
jgi:hypothetical protein